LTFNVLHRVGSHSIKLFSRKNSSQLKSEICPVAHSAGNTGMEIPFSNKTTFLNVRCIRIYVSLFQNILDQDDRHIGAMAPLWLSHVFLADDETEELSTR
jgi:hypothetical protein